MAKAKKPSLPPDLPDLPNDWHWQPLGELVDPKRGICYGIVQPGRHDPDGVPFLNTQNITDGVVDTEVDFRVAQHLHDKYKRSTLRGGEILLTLVGANFGRVAVAPMEVAGRNCSRAVGVIPVTDQVPYVMFALRSPLSRHYMDEWANTTAQPTFNLSDVANLPIPMPPESARDAIASILGALDDKIELNRRMNATLESLARAIFKSWFVDFDPVKINAGQMPASSHALATHDPKVLDLFPSTFQDSELGPIPEGWTDTTVGETFQLTMGQSPPGSTYNEDGEGMPFYQGRRDFGFRFPERRVYCTEPKRLAKQGDTLVTVRAPVGDLNMANEECCVGRGVAAIRHNTESRSYTYYAMHNLTEQFKNYEGGGTVFGSINKKNFDALKIIEPTPETIEMFDKLIGDLDSKIENLEYEAASLANFRDALLPQLLSGDLPVPVALTCAEEAFP